MSAYYAIFRPDYDNQDYINLVKVNPASVNGDFIYVNDINNTKDGAWANTDGPLGIVGLHILETPKNLGVTDFHYFGRDVAPKVDEEMWPVISSNPADQTSDNSASVFHMEVTVGLTIHASTVSRNIIPTVHRLIIML